MTHKRIAVVTGSNRGIGAGIVALLATQQHAEGPLIIYATSRAGKPQATIPPIQPQHNNEIHHAKLDITSKSSVLDFLRTATAATNDDGSGTSGGRAIDILINNAGTNLNKNEDFTAARETINVNYRALRDMCLLFLSHGGMRSHPGARIVNVSSTASSLAIHAPELQARFRNAVSVEEVDGLADEYLALYEEGRLRGSGFGKNQGNGGEKISYQVSKACVNALTRVLARENKEVLINACCPGWVDTDMGRYVGKPPKTVEEGAKVPVRLAVGEVRGRSGEYWAEESVFGRGQGEVRSW